MFPIFKSLAFALAAVTSLSAAPPNLIIILADDMGYSDTGCYGGEIATPAIDKLAKEGIERLFKALEESGKASNTQILIMSDNGADSFSLVDQAMLKQGKLPGDPGSNWQQATGWELFNTKGDPLETKNLAETKPDLVAAMSERWLRWWKDESGKPDYQPEGGKEYKPSAMPATLADRYPIPK